MSLTNSIQIKFNITADFAYNWTLLCIAINIIKTKVGLITNTIFIRSKIWLLRAPIEWFFYLDFFFIQITSKKFFSIKCFKSNEIPFCFNIPYKSVSFPDKTSPKTTHFWSCLKREICKDNLFACNFIIIIIIIICTVVFH